VSEPLAGTLSDADAVPGAEPAPGIVPGAEPPPGVAQADPLEPYRRWAMVLFAIMALVGIFGTVVVLAAMPNRAVFYVLVGSVVLFVATLLAVVAGLRGRAPWSVHAIAPICYVIIAAAVIRVIVALSQGNFTIPLEGIGALMVLTRDHRSAHLPAMTDQDRWRVWLAVAVVVFAQVLPYATGVI